MQKYYFNVPDLEPSVDEHGEEFPDDSAAWKQATMFAGELLKDLDGKFLPGQEFSVEVTDLQKRILYRIRIISSRVD